jgi:osmotically-inducible protein OsmY
MDLFSPANSDREDCGGSLQPLIGRQAEIRIRGTSYLALRDVTCIARGDILHLRGRLPSHYLKQIAQEIAASVEGVRQVRNGIEVSRPVRTRSARGSLERERDQVERNNITMRGEDSLPASTQG